MNFPDRVERVKTAVRNSVAKANPFNIPFVPERREVLTKGAKAAAGLLLATTAVELFVACDTTTPNLTLEQKGRNRLQEIASSLVLVDLFDRSKRQDQQLDVSNTKIARLVSIFYPNDPNIKFGFLNLAHPDADIPRLLVENTLVSTGMQREEIDRRNYTYSGIILIQRTGADGESQIDFISGNHVTFTYFKIPYEAMLDSAKTHDLTDRGFMGLGSSSPWSRTAAKDPRIEVKKLPEVELKGDLLATKTFIKKVLTDNGINATCRAETDDNYATYHAGIFYLRITPTDQRSSKRLAELNDRIGKIKKYNLGNNRGDVITREGFRRALMDAEWTVNRPIAVPTMFGEVLNVRASVDGFVKIYDSQWNIAALPAEEQTNPAYSK